ncbi:hypothetical protein NLM33_42725 [Bradyrhizobium sp. CCGUVB1N3]|uniref:hypothetical protein n=1 Tax=Bradyrhizobium sp. CCGUVB1N3 TaxID=2949629 RepID=UPI0020B41EF3|nr:hypothetical protein [Bradyrhizobium sp. CCGUVB1N3]MCP3476876.1 hypothetical protein [Bradyrhizobium sp. CCGUVB1N3]
MTTFCGRFMTPLLVAGLAFPAIAGERRDERAAPRSGATATLTGKASLTGKERLGPKWTDEQRIDDCNVPPDKRGASLRPITCPNAQTN